MVSLKQNEDREFDSYMRLWIEILEVKLVLR